jgi:endogenous inhibitor of DNA gyrase (YacG/DUF329 family)
MKCSQCGGSVPVVAVGRPRRFCSPECSRLWTIEGKRLDREIESVRRERDDTAGKGHYWNGEWQIRKADALTAELEKLEERRELRRRGVSA